MLLGIWSNLCWNNKIILCSHFIMATNENHLRTFFDDKLNYTKKHYPTQYLFWRNQKLPLKHTYLSKRFKYVFESDYHKSASYFLDQLWNSHHSAQRASAIYRSGCISSGENGLFTMHWHVTRVLTGPFCFSSPVKIISLFLRIAEERVLSGESQECCSILANIT